MTSSNSLLLLSLFPTVLLFHLFTSPCVFKPASFRNLGQFVCFILRLLCSCAPVLLPGPHVSSVFLLCSLWFVFIWIWFLFSFPLGLSFTCFCLDWWVWTLDICSSLKLAFASFTFLPLCILHLHPFLQKKKKKKCNNTRQMFKLSAWWCRSLSYQNDLQHYDIQYELN